MTDFNPHITQPGVYDIPEDAYHADPVVGGSLSSSEARPILACPAKGIRAKQFKDRWSASMNFGAVAHRLVLGRGDDYAVVEANDWRTNAAKEARDAARDAGKRPLLTKDMDAAREMVAALHSHRFHDPKTGEVQPTGAGDLFRNGIPEQTLVWRDGASGVMCRARIDWTPKRGRIYPEYKTTADAEPGFLQRQVWTLGYHMQAEWYLRGIRALGLHRNPRWLWVFQEKTAPYLVTCAQPDAEMLQWAKVANDKALDIYRACTAAGRWPGYVDSVTTLSLPPWAVNELDRREQAGEFDTATVSVQAAE